MGHILLLIFIPQLLLAAKTEAYKQQTDVPYFSGDVLEVKGFHGNITFKKSSVSKVRVVATYDQNFADDEEYMQDWLLKTSREHENKVGKILVKIKGPQSRETWAKSLRGKKIPKINLVIFAPEMNIEVFWRHGDLYINDWSAQLRINLQQGKLSVIGGQGSLHVEQQKGIANIVKRKGKLDFNGYNTKLSLQSIEGPQKISNFDGKTILNGSIGHITLQQNRGKVEIVKGEGELNFKSKSANIKILNYLGSVHGRSESGPIFADLSGELKFNVKTLEGAVKLKLKNSGANMNLGTVEGNFYTPRYLRVTRYPYIKVIKGRLRGSENGRAYIRTKSGNIQIL